VTIDVMTSSPAAETTAASSAPPRFARRTDGRMVAGVAAALADQFGLQPIVVRLAFCLLSALSGFGLVLYLGLWVFTPTADRAVAEGMPEEPVGLAAAERTGKRQGRRRLLPSRAGDAGQLAALAAIALGVILAVQRTPLGLRPELFVPLLLATGGLMLVWRTADEQERRKLAELSPRAPWLGALIGKQRTATLARLIGGLVLLGAGIVAFLAGQDQLDAILSALSGALVILAGIGLLLGPWLWRLWRDLESERRERIISEERADVAAHLHDSVLQTLALIQKQADDPKSVTRLARSQERELRGWLYGDRRDDETSFAAALTKNSAEVEDTFGIPVEVVTVGDAEIDDVVRALLQAAREATVNAAKHSGAALVDVFAEAGPDGVEVFVRDRGVGFDPDTVPQGRQGVRRSIVDRMERHGGSATIRSTPGEGTEVTLSTRRTS
jgi:signal transduction histidine kinase/phage shock protein PspC (stress-responsive transcriptional regulator)